jgi:hypothetical protein
VTVNKPAVNALAGLHSSRARQTAKIATAATTDTSVRHRTNSASLCSIVTDRSRSANHGTAAVSRLRERISPSTEGEIVAQSGGRGRCDVQRTGHHSPPSAKRSYGHQLVADRIAYGAGASNSRVHATASR